MSVDMPHGLHPIETLCIHVVVVVGPSCSVHLAGDMALPHCSRY